MQVIINNSEYDLQPETTLEKVPVILGLESSTGIAFAVNDTVIARSEWGMYCLQSNDRVLLIRAIQGG